MKISKSIAIITGAVCLLICLSKHVAARILFPDASAIGIIGDPDGPTAVLIAQEPTPKIMMFTAFVLSLISLTFFCFEKLQKIKTA